MIAKGREAQALGFGGGTSFLYWLTLALKFIVPIGVLFSAYVLYEVLIRPSREDLAEARQLIDESRSISDVKRVEALALESQVGKLRQEHQQLEQQIGQMQEARAKAEMETRKAEAEARKADQAWKEALSEALSWKEEVKAQKAIHAALRAFD